MKTLSLLFVMVIAIVSCKKNNAEMLASAAVAQENNNATLPEQKEIYKKVNANIGGYLEALPVGYSDNSNNNKRYPLLITIHGILELGNGTTDLYLLKKIFIPKLLNTQKFPASFASGNDSFSFIVLSPQFKTKPTARQLNGMYNYAIKKYRVDTTRMYLTGLSMGGTLVYDYANAYGARLSAVVPFCADAYPTAKKARNIANNNIAVWSFHNLYDTTTSADITKAWTATINSYHPAITAIETIFKSGGHDAWTKGSSPDYRENNMNIYEWMLQYHK